MPKNVTFIDDLFDANSLMSDSDDYIDKDNAERESYTNQVMKRHIRKQNDNSQYLFDMNGGKHSPPPQPQQQSQLQYIPQPQYQPQYIPQHQHQHQYYDHQELSCMTIANHIKECPICSKFYNCDNSIYIICIVLLIIICIILLKRIIEKA